MCTKCAFLVGANKLIIFQFPSWVFYDNIVNGCISSLTPFHGWIDNFSFKQELRKYFLNCENSHLSLSGHGGPFQVAGVDCRTPHNGRALCNVFDETQRIFHVFIICFHHRQETERGRLVHAKLGRREELEIRKAFQSPHFSIMERIFSRIFYKSGSALRYKSGNLRSPPEHLTMALKPFIMTVVKNNNIKSRVRDLGVYIIEICNIRTGALWYQFFEFSNWMFSLVTFCTTCYWFYNFNVNHSLSIDWLYCSS